MSVPHAEVIGDPIAQSKSPTIHRFWLQKLGLEGDYRRAHVRAQELAFHLAGRRSDPAWRGCNVTVPHKQAVIAQLDAVDPTAAAIGAVNTVRNEDGRLVGYNSDAPGFLEPIRSRLARPSLLRMARILGAGGAARAIAHALKAEGFTLVIAARDAAKAEGLQGELGGDCQVATLAELAAPLGLDWGDRTGALDLFVNATSLGMTGQPPLAVDFSNVPPGAIVYDIVYAPLETPLLAEARARGHDVVDGLEMLVGQAALAFERFFGAPAPRDHDAELRKLLTA